jgi:hypothetical protein
MDYVFVDEAYSRMETRTKIAVASWAVEQAVWGRQAGRFAALYRAPVLESLGSMFDRLDSRASISAADLENTVFRSGEIDGTDDISRMARPDNIWSQCALFGVSGLIRDLVEAGQEIGTFIEGRDLGSGWCKSYASPRNSPHSRSNQLRLHLG